MRVCLAIPRLKLLMILGSRFSRDLISSCRMIPSKSKRQEYCKQVKEEEEEEEDEEKSQRGMSTRMM